MKSRDYTDTHSRIDSQASRIKSPEEIEKQAINNLKLIDQTNMITTEMDEDFSDYKNNEGMETRNIEPDESAPNIATS